MSLQKRMRNVGMYLNRTAMTATVASALLASPALHASLTVNVVDGTGSPMTNGFRWLVEQDTTTVTLPDVQTNNSVSISINRSYCPVIATGHAATATAVIAVPATNRYVVSVLPDAGYTMSSATLTNGQSSVNVVVNATPVPTAQITIEAYNDNNPINNARDLTEPGLAGFRVVINDNLGQASQDAFGHTIGTTYQQDTNGNFLVDGNGMPLVDQVGTGIILTDTNGNAVIKYMMPARYQVQVIPPVGETWYQTSTIDGTRLIDAWVKLNEPAALIEFGMISKHVSYGFVSPTQLPWGVNPPTNGATITGRLVDDHFSKPPAINTSFPGAPVPEGLIALNNLAPETGLYAAECNPDGTFTITNVPPGTYQLVTFDKPQDLTIGFNTVVVTSNGEVVALGGNGHLIDFRYRVFDPDKAAVLGDKQYKPYLIDQVTGTRMVIPDTPKLGPLRQSATRLEAGKIYFMLFANSGRLVKSGRKVTVVIGDFKVENLTVE